MSLIRFVTIKRRSCQINIIQIIHIPYDVLKSEHNFVTNTKYMQQMYAKIVNAIKKTEPILNNIIIDSKEES